MEAADAAADVAGAPYLEEYRLVTSDGRVVWVRDEAVHVPASEGRAAHWIGLIVDITKEKEAETRAAEVEQRYRTLVEQLPIVTYIDAPDESLANIFVSPQINDLLGRPSGATGDEWAERVHPDDRDRARQETVEGVRSGEPFTLEYRMVRDDGRVIWVRDSATTVRDEAGRARIRPRVLLRYHATEGSRAPARRSSSAATAAWWNSSRPSRTWTRPTTRLTSIYVSPQVEKVLGLSATRSSPTTRGRRTSIPRTASEAVQRIREAIRRADPFTLEYRMVRPDGSIVWIRDQGTVVKDEAGRPTYVQGLYDDISEQKRLESELRSEAVKFKSLAERIPAVVYIEGEGGSDDAPFYISPQYEELFGYTPDERQANPTLWRELLHPEDRDACDRGSGALLRGGRLQRGLPDGGSGRERIVWVHDETVLIRDEDGEPLVLAGRDVRHQRAEASRAGARAGARDGTAAPSSGSARPTT